MAKRRRVLMGLGALAFGSGAMSVNAAFNDTVDSEGDMRVVADDALIIEAGKAFRGGNKNDPYGTAVTTYNAKYFLDTDLGPSNNTFFNQQNETLDGTDTGADDGGLGSDVDFSDLPAAFVNGGTNGSLVIKTAVPLEDNEFDFPNLLQVENNQSTDVNVGITFDFGVDTQNSGSGSYTQSAYSGAVDEGKVPGTGSDNGGVYSFVAEDGTVTVGNQISTDGAQGSWSSIADQDPYQHVNISSGNIQQIGLKVDLNPTTVLSQIETASATGGLNGVWGSDQDSVQLVQRLAFHTGADTESTNGAV